MPGFEQSDRKSTENLVRSISKEEVQLLERESQRKFSFGVMLSISIITLFLNLAIFMNEPLSHIVRANRSFFFRGSMNVYQGETETSMAAPGNEISKILLPQLQTSGENELLLTDSIM